MPVSSQTTVSKKKLGRSSNRPQMGKKKAQRLAADIIHSNKLSPEKKHLIQWLSVAGALTTMQIKAFAGIGLRSLQRYFYDSRSGLGHIVDYYRGDSALTETFDLPVTKELRHIRVWTLGELGRAIALELKFKPIAYNGYAIKQLTHDVLCNQSIFVLTQCAKDFGYEWNWYNKNEIRIVRQKKIVLEPDALLVFSRDKKSHYYCIEFHNEHGSARGNNKAELYLTARNREYYRDWNLTSMPRVLAIGHYDSVINGYARGLHSSYIGDMFFGYRSASSLFEKKPYRWVNISEYREARMVGFEFDPNSSDEIVYKNILEPRQDPGILTGDDLQRVLDGLK